MVARSDPAHRSDICLKRPGWTGEARTRAVLTTRSLCQEDNTTEALMVLVSSGEGDRRNEDYCFHKLIVFFGRIFEPTQIQTTTATTPYSDLVVGSIALKPSYSGLVHDAIPLIATPTAAVSPSYDACNKLRCMNGDSRTW
jgi:hypothetical protein